jgi:hypothetical protein
MSAGYVQKAANGESVGTTVAVAFPSNVTVGNQIVVTIRKRLAGETGSISDNLGNTYTAVEVDQNVDGSEPASFYRCKSIATGGACTVTYTASGTSGRHGITVREFSGLDSSAALDASNKNTGSGDASVECGAVTTSAAGVIVTGVSTGGGQTLTADSDYAEAISNTTGRASSAHRITTTALTGEEAIHTLSAAVAWGSVVGAAKEAAGPVTHATTGVLVGPGAAVAGTASSATTRPSTGALTGPGAAIVGTAARTRAHATTGVLAGQVAAIAGVAARTRQHATDGVLAGPGAEIIGAAAREGAPVAHATSGALAGPGTSLAGTAARERLHPATGDLIGQSSTLSGIAARMRQHAASGAVAGPGAEVVGAAVRVAAPVAHDTSGALTGPGAVIEGAAERPADTPQAGLDTFTLQRLYTLGFGQIEPPKPFVWPKEVLEEKKRTRRKKRKKRGDVEQTPALPDSSVHAAALRRRQAIAALLL